MKRSIFYVAIIAIFAFGFYVFSENSCFKESNISQNPKASNISSMSKDTNEESEAKLKTELVCMVNDAFMGIKQFPVPMGDKMYYGCCEKCVDKIKNNRQLRYAKDPLTGEEVDKASAFIVMKSKEDHSVYYFKSEDNYNKFQSSNN